MGSRYQNILESMKDDGFNAIRVNWSDISLNSVPVNDGRVDFNKTPDLRGLNQMQIFQKFVDQAGRISLKIIFDHHTDEGSGGQQPNDLWIDKGLGTDGTDGAGVTGTVDSAAFQADWLQFTNAFAGSATVIGFDLDNGPLSNGVNPQFGEAMVQRTFMPCTRTPAT